MDKSDTQFDYRVKAILGENRISTIQSPAVEMPLECATPPEFPHGIAGMWSPETYLLTSIAGCYINTFQALADKFDFMLIGLSCDARGTVALVDGKYTFTEITVTPLITLEKQSEEAKALRIAQKAHKYCLISNSLKCPVLLRENFCFLTATAV